MCMCVCVFLNLLLTSMFHYRIAILHVKRFLLQTLVTPNNTLYILYRYLVMFYVPVCVCACACVRDIYIFLFGTILSSSKHSVLIVTVSTFCSGPSCFIWYCMSCVFCSFCYFHSVLRLKRHTKYIHDDCLYGILSRSLHSVLCILYTSSIWFFDICGIPLF